MTSRILVLTLVAACAHNVAQDKATTEDGKPKGAVPVPFVNNRASVFGIVTYPGGDRVDWKTIELPKDLKGTLDVTLTWSTPRPGLQLGFDVFDQWNALAASSGRGRGKATKKRGNAKGRTRHVAVTQAQGKYSIRIYAVGRGDAGRYKLDLSFTEVDDRTEPDWTKIEVPEPPNLASLPTIVAPPTPCDLNKFDTSNPDCANKCPNVNPDQDWPGCRNKCVVRPKDASIPACAREMSCDTRALDRRIPDCRRHFGKCLDPAKPDPNNPNCDGAVIPPARLRITTVTIQGDELVIRTGGSPGIDKTWIAEVLAGGDNTTPPAGDRLLAGGTLRIHNIDSAFIELRAKRSSLTKDQLDANKWIRFRAPPKTNP